MCVEFILCASIRMSSHYNEHSSLESDLWKRFMPHLLFPNCLHSQLHVCFHWSLLFVWHFHQPGGFLAAAVVVLVLTPLAVVDGVFLAAVVPVIDFAPLVARAVPVAFFSPTLLAGPVGFLAGAVVGVLFFTAADGAFLATPLVWGFDTPFARRLWDALLGRGPVVVLDGFVVPGFVLAAALLVVLALESPDVLLLVLAAVVSLACSSWGSTWPVSPAGCCGIASSAGLAAWLGSCPAAGAASFTGLESSVSIGSIAAVTTPSGFISLRVVVVRLCGAGLMDLNLTGWVQVYRLSRDSEVWSGERKENIQYNTVSQQQDQTGKAVCCVSDRQADPQECC